MTMPTATDQPTKPLWSPPARSASGPLQRDLQVDVLVIGGGITGVTTALRLAEAHKRVALVEARTICSGVTGRTTAHITEVVDPRYHEIESKFGREGARLVAASSRGAIEYIAAMSERLAIDCDLVRAPGYLYTERAEHVDQLAKEMVAASRAGVAVQRDAEVPLPFPTAGSLKFFDQLRFHPTRYVEGMLAEAQRLGVEVYEHTRIDEITDGEPVRARTSDGHVISADAVVCATHIPLNRFLLHTKLGHYQSYALAFAGAPTGDALFWDTEDPYHYTRTANVDGLPYLVVGGGDHKTGEEKDTELRFREIAEYAASRFGVGAPAYRWSAQVVEPIDGLPYIGRNAASRNVYVATGYSGNGMTYGTIAALLIGDLVLGRESPYEKLFDATRVKPSALGAFVTENAKVPVHLIGDRLKPAEVKSIDEIEPDHGCILKADGKRLAVYRDETGGLHPVSAVCPHMGCVVKFNSAERTWDCPCHGSRFTVDGEVIDGPAVQPLERHEIATSATSDAHARRRGEPL